MQRTKNQFNFVWYYKLQQCSFRGGKTLGDCEKLSICWEPTINSCMQRPLVWKSARSFPFLQSNQVVKVADPINGKTEGNGICRNYVAFSQGRLHQYSYIHQSSLLMLFFGTITPMVSFQEERKKGGS